MRIASQDKYCLLASSLVPFKCISLIAHMPCRNKRYEAEAAAHYLMTTKAWAPSSQRVEFTDARGHVLHSAASLLNFPIFSSNDLVLILRQYSMYLPPYNAESFAVSIPTPTGYRRVQSGGHNFPLLVRLMDPSGVKVAAQ